MAAAAVTAHRSRYLPHEIVVEVVSPGRDRR
jgi:hypothetical protein